MTDRIPFLDRLEDNFTGLGNAAGRGGRRWGPRLLSAGAAGMLVASLALVVVLSSSDGKPTRESTRAGGATASPQGSAASDAASERAWGSFALAGAEEAEHYESFPTMNEGASAVIVADVVDVQLGRVFGLSDADGSGAVQYVSVLLKPSAVVSGEKDLVTHDGLVILELGPVEVGFDTSSIEKDMVGDTVLAFLHRKGAPIPGSGGTSDPQELAFGVYRTVSSQGLFLDSGGKAEAVLYVDEGFPSNVDGQSFGAVVDDAEDAADG